MIKFLRWIFATDLREALNREGLERKQALDRIEERLENQITHDYKGENHS